MLKDIFFLYLKRWIGCAVSCSNIVLLNSAANRSLAGRSRLTEWCNSVMMSLSYGFLLRTWIILIDNLASVAVISLQPALHHLSDPSMSANSTWAKHRRTLSLYGGLFGLLFYNGSEGQNITTTDQCEESKLALCDCWLGYPIWVGYMCLLDYARNGILRYEDKQESKKIVPNFHHLKPTACLSTAKFKPSQ